MANGKGMASGGDTSRDALEAQYAALRRLSIAQRLSLMDDLTRLVQSMTREGVRRRHPGLTEAQIEAKYFEITLGPELAARVLEHRNSRPSRRAP